MLCIAAVLPSCQKKEIEEAPASVEITLRASMSSEDSKISLGGDDHKHILWSVGEEIKVFRGSYSGKFTSDATAPSETASFKGTLDSKAKGDYWAVCPYSDDASFDSSKSIITLTVPDAQTSPEGSFNSASFPILAHSNTTSLSFKNLCGGAKFCVTEAGIKKVTISGNNDEIIAGKIKVKFNSSNNPEKSDVVSGSKSITVTPQGTETFTPGVYYYVVLIPQTFSKGIKLSYSKGLSCAVFTSSKSITVSRSGFGTISNKEQGLEFLTPFTTLTQVGQYSGTNTEEPVLLNTDCDQISYAKKDIGPGKFIRFSTFKLESGKFVQLDVPASNPPKDTVFTASINSSGVLTTPPMKVSRNNNSLIWIETEDGSGFIIPADKSW